MAVTVDDVRDVSLRGEFDDVTDQQITDRITLAETFVNRTVWDTAASGGEDLGDFGVKFLAAHFLAVDLRGTVAAAGPVTAEAAGGLSRSYGLGVAISFDESMLGRTIYGQRFLQIKRTLLLSPVATNTSGGGVYSAG
jgi:hypothetical protein